MHNIKKNKNKKLAVRKLEEEGKNIIPLQLHQGPAAIPFAYREKAT